MQGWVLTLLERDSTTARVAAADSSGNLKFSKVSLAAVQTAYLLSPDFLVQSVLSMPSTTANTIRQYFTLNKTTLPRVVQKGSILNFQSTDAISIQSGNSTDTDGDGIPDGMASLGLIQSSPGGFALSTDTDKDGTVNESDADIDSDGLPNAIDSDGDGDATIDALDADANGNGVADSQENNSSQHFAVGVEYVAAQYIVTSSASTVRFITKVRDTITPTSVKIRGATSLLGSSSYIKSDGSSGGSWDLSLADDGVNDDGSTGDLLYGRSVVLASGKSPRGNQVVFFQLEMGSGAEAFTAEYPFLFPPLTPTVPTTSYDATTRTVTLEGDPLGTEITGFVWVVSIADSDGITIYEGPAVAGATRTFVIPSNVMQTGQTYTYRASAQTLDKVAGYPSIVVRSDEGTITN